MTTDLEHLYSRIGQYALDLAGEPFERGFVRVEMADDFGSIGLFVDRGDGTFTYFSDDDGGLYDLFEALRTAFKTAGMGVWSQATFTMQQDGTFSITFGYDDISDLGQSAQRREDWISKVLGSQPVIKWPDS